LLETGKQVRLTITDNGNGFDGEALAQDKARTGLGILSMHERAEAIGGQVRVDSTPGGGTRVIVEVDRSHDYPRPPGG
jgi:signal transduction histidine kinase